MLLARSAHHSFADLLVVGIRASIGSETVLEEVSGPEGQSRDTEGTKRCGLTVPRHCYRAGYQPGPNGDGEPVIIAVFSFNPLVAILVGLSGGLSSRVA